MARMGRKTLRWQDALSIPLFLLAATGVGVLFDAIGFPETNIVLVYVAAVLLVARFTHGLYERASSYENRYDEEGNCVERIYYDFEGNVTDRVANPGEEISFRYIYRPDY